MIVGAAIAPPVTAADVFKNCRRVGFPPDTATLADFRDMDTILFKTQVKGDHAHRLDMQPEQPSSYPAETLPTTNCTNQMAFELQFPAF
jgi:hypothetical protein